MSTNESTGAKPAGHLINILKATRAHHPNFTLFIGAGASAQSGVKTARDMISEWRDCYWECYGKHTGEAKATFLEKQTWHDAEDEYAALFEKLYDQPSLRREYIEACMEEACPSWGYIYLVRLIEKDVFNTIFTTNFDDLLNESCYLFSSNVRPVVCAHDSSIRSIRITSKRPKIIKLHGDFLFDSIKNTLRELETLETNMREKFRQYAGEFGMVFIGYSGRDRSIMDTLDALLRAEVSFPHGIYWCVRKGSELPEKVDVLRRFPKFHVIEINGFDDFFAELHAALEFGQHPVFENPYAPVSQRLNMLLEKLPIPTKLATSIPIPMALEQDVRYLGDRLTQNNGRAIPDVRLPYRLLSSIERRNGKLELARKYALKHLEERGPNVDVLSQFRLCTSLLLDAWDDELGEATLKVYEENLPLFEVSPGTAFELALPLMKWKRFGDAKKVLDRLTATRWSNEELAQFYVINCAQLHVHQGELLPPDLAKQIEAIAKQSPSEMSKFGAHCVLKQEEKAIEAIERIKKSNKPIDRFDTQILDWPITMLLSEEARTKLATLIK